MGRFPFPVNGNDIAVAKSFFPGQSGCALYANPSITTTVLLWLFFFLLRLPLFFSLFLRFSSACFPSVNTLRLLFPSGVLLSGFFRSSPLFSSARPPAPLPGVLFFFPAPSEFYCIFRSVAASFLFGPSSPASPARCHFSSSYFRLLLQRSLPLQSPPPLPSCLPLLLPAATFLLPASVQNLLQRSFRSIAASSSFRSIFPICFYAFSPWSAPTSPRPGFGLLPCLLFS